MQKDFDEAIDRINESRQGELPAVEGTTVVWATYDIAEVKRHPTGGGKLELEYVDPDQGTASPAELRQTHLGTDTARKPGVYVWFVLQTDFKHGDDTVLVAYVGQSGGLSERIGTHTSGGGGSSKRKPLAQELDPYLDPKDGRHRVHLAMVGEARIHGRRWDPEQEDERLLVEAAMVVHGVTIRGHGMINAATAKRTARA